MEINPQESCAIHLALSEYYHNLRIYFSQKEVFKKMIRMIRAATSEEDAETPYMKYHQFHFEPRFSNRSIERKTRIIKGAMELLDYFGVRYPSPPESIRNLFD